MHNLADSTSTQRCSAFAAGTITKFYKLGTVRVAKLNQFLRFKPKYLDRVLRGDKRVTLRLGIVMPRRQLVYILSDDMVYGEAIIESVQYARIRELDSNVLREEGVSSLDELVAELRELYGDVKPSDVVSIIRFRIVRKYPKPIDVRYVLKHVSE